MLIENDHLPSDRYDVFHEDLNIWGRQFSKLFFIKGRNVAC